MTPAAASPMMAPGTPAGEQKQALWAGADALQAQRQAAAADYLARVQAGQRASLAQQQLGLGGLQQQQMATVARGPLAQRAAMYGQARAGGELIAQQAQRAAQEAMAARALQQETYGAGAAQSMQQAQQALQGYGISREAEAAARAAHAAKAAGEEAMMQQIVMGSVGAAGGAMAMSDRRLKQGVRRPRTAAEQELYRALRRAQDHG
jgi:hypothetical protein